MTDYKFEAEDLAEFTVGETVNIDEFRYETACAIFGKPLVDEYNAWKANPPQPPLGTVTVVSIDRGAGVVTFGAAPTGRPDSDG